MSDDIDVSKAAGVGLMLGVFATKLRADDHEAAHLKLVLEGLSTMMMTCTEEPTRDQLQAIVELTEAEMRRIHPLPSDI